MQKEEKRRKFHQSLLNLLYPPPPSPHLQDRDEEQPINILQNCLDTDLISDEFGKSGCSSSSDDGGECGPQKLTRAQRKRIRKKKVREAASHRRKLIGPLLPGDDDGSGDLSNESQGVVRNATEKSDIGSAMPGERAGCTNQNKRKHRRMAKKQARERSALSTSENFHQDCGPCSNNDRLT
ncbi:uncharacterized protein LOC131303493 [Rhododendron vialii]|uniref:uncharacterized protein LOC131303493 n=1 Tax=Rhododendron vialii TaxID=182163 RepID=UPI00265EC13B|nr:uncharacterized protein LOC131303493 [Rhododendron vialii]